jgi:NitT/TauT family transport system substrate-binding protein
MKEVNMGLRFSRRRFLGALTIGSFALSFGACSAHPSPLRIGANTWPGYLPLRLAQTRRYFDPAQVRILDFPSTSAVITALRNGTVEGACLTLDEFLMLVENGLSLTLILVFNISNGADAIVARPGITNMADLAGRKIGVETGALGAYLLARALEKNGLLPSDVRIQTLPFDQHASAFVLGDVDAVVTFDPVLSELRQYGGHVIFSTREIPGEIVDVLAVTHSAIQKQSHFLSPLLQGHFKARSALLKAPDAIATELGARAGLLPEGMPLVLEGLELPDEVLNRRLLSPSSDGLGPRIERLSGFMVQQGLLKAPVGNPERLLSARFIPSGSLT